MTSVRKAILAFATILAVAAPAFALTVPPKPTGHVNDYAGALTADARAQLEAQLTAYGQGTTRQYVVAIFKSLDGESLEDFSIRLSTAWKIGGKASSDGVLISLFLAEHKIRVEVGYGLEGKLTDIYGGHLIRDTLAPAFRKGDIAGGLSAAFADIDFQVTGEHRAIAGVQPRQQPARDNDSGKAGGFVLFLVLVIIVVVLASRGRGGRGGGSGVGNTLSFIAGMMLNGSGSSSWGGGGGDGGGFSGGGGGFGGGGASGGW